MNIDVNFLEGFVKPAAARCAADMAKSTHHRIVARIREFFEWRGIGPPDQ